MKYSAGCDEIPSQYASRIFSKVCGHYFGAPRHTASSHRVYRTPWQGDPRVNIQNAKGKAKAYQVKQVLGAIRRLDDENDEE